MLWQDIVLTIVNTGFIVALIPQVVKVYRTKSTEDFAWISIGFYCVGLLAIAVIFITLKFYLTSIPYFITSFLWGLIVVKKIQYESRKSNSTHNSSDEHIT